MHAYAASHLLPYLIPGGRVLDVGSGSGYLSAVLWHLMNESPKEESESTLKPTVTGIDHIDALVDWSISNLKRDGLEDALDKKMLEIVVGDGRLGWFPFLVLEDRTYRTKLSRICTKWPL